VSSGNSTATAFAKPCGIGSSTFSRGASLNDSATFLRHVEGIAVHQQISGTVGYATGAVGATARRETTRDEGKA
jgi:hypothetical protein